MSDSGAPVRISVIVPSYNSGAYLRESLASALEQDPPPYEILVQDGASTDDTLAILRSFANRLSWVSGADGGQADALNRAITRASGDVVVWLNADDKLLPGALSAATAAFDADPALGFVYGDFEMVDAAGRVIRRFRSSLYSWRRVFKKGCYIFSGALFIRRDALLAVGAFDPSLRACMDLDLLLRLDAAGPSQHLGRAVAQFRVHHAAKSSRIGLTFILEAFRVRSRYARRSWRLWPDSVRVALWSAVIQLAAPLRYSPLWPRHGRGKTL